MIVGTVRPEEARIFDRDAGYHQFHGMTAGETFGSFEVFWHDANSNDTGPDDDDGDFDPQPSGWYWHACFPGCIPDGEPNGPFATSTQAMYDADEYHPDNLD